ncbi:uncharacterized protein F5147DRAFT_713771 [Suillus discolor]|uniref:Uncharacterized protein n=1 Tax=Suillus discolor TaxID=1912936 RepID=A0A9P7EZ86_9AGAM|nr:uncharacterized protein F5147DRAFT_713771 [Suillus discolor]KAG2098389.1 hypothetical protein F5147DRAFT_713771 [Suillus discolor]
MDTSPNVVFILPVALMYPFSSVSSFPYHAKAWKALFPNPDQLSFQGPGGPSYNPPVIKRSLVRNHASDLPQLRLRFPSASAQTLLPSHIHGSPPKSLVSQFHLHIAPLNESFDVFVLVTT